MQCPRCGAALAEQTQMGVQVDACRACRGLWLDKGELERLVAMINAAEWEKTSARSARLPEALPGPRSLQKAGALGRLMRFLDPHR